GIDPYLVRPGPLRVGAEIGDELDHGLDVLDPRNVREPDLLGGEQGGREDRERAVLVARGPHRPGQGAAALDDEGLHRARNATGGHVPLSESAPALEGCRLQATVRRGTA